jgi:AcrR family transcriptional regulator
MADVDKRDRIIAAAYEVLSEKGYDRASTKEIASTAGVAQGLINYYFPSKDLLFAEVFRRETEKYCKSFGVLKEFSDKPLTPDVLEEILDFPKSRAIEDPDWFRLHYELVAIGLRNEKALNILREMLELKRTSISEIINAIVTLPGQHSRTMASILYAVFEGLGLQKIVDPEFNSDESFEMLAVMLGAYFEFVNKKRES